MSRISTRFAQLKAANRAAFVPFIMSGDPDYDVSFEILKGLPGAGADLIELGMPFTDPMADGGAIQLSGQRALKAGATMAKTLDMISRFRAHDQATPIVLMGYYNPIYARGVATFLEEAVAVGVDGLIIVDLPPEEDEELCLPARAAGLDFIRLATPTTDARRLPAVVANTSGFVYYVSITGVTGAAEAEAGAVAPAVARIGAASGLPVCVGFGVRTPERAEAIATVADGVVVGSAIVSMIGEGRSTAEVLAAVRALSDGVRRAPR